MENIDISVLMIGILFTVACIAGFIDVLVGGGGLLTIPALLAAGVPPLAALGTNKLQAVGGSGTATVRLLLSGHLNLKTVAPLMLLSFIGSMFGSVLIQGFDPGLLKWVIPIVIVFIAVYFLVAPNAKQAQEIERVSHRVYAATAVPAVGFYDGMFGPATGSFFVLSGVALRGQNIRFATILAKSLNLASNFASLLVFLAYGQFVLIYGLVMILGQFIGASIGTKTLLKIDPMALRYLLVAMSVLVLAFWLYREAL